MCGGGGRDDHDPDDPDNLGPRARKLIRKEDVPPWKGWTALPFVPLVLLAMCGGGDGGDDRPPGGKTDRLRTPYGDRYPETKRGPIQRGGTGGTASPPKRRYLTWFAPALALLICGDGSDPEKDLDDPGYDPFRISRRAHGRKDGPWNRFVVACGGNDGERVPPAPKRPQRDVPTWSRPRPFRRLLDLILRPREA
jgi:hypothetical protein